MVMMDDSRAHFDAFLALYHAITDGDPESFYGWTPSDKLAFWTAVIKKLTIDHEFREDFMAYGGRVSIAYKTRDSEEGRTKRRPNLSRLDEIHIGRRGF